MSEIPFVDALGDSLEAAFAAAPSPSRRLRLPRSGRGRLRLLVAVLALALAGFAGARALLSTTELATNSIACYSGTSDDANMAAISADGQPPLQACGAVLGV